MHRPQGTATAHRRTGTGRGAVHRDSASQERQGTRRRPQPTEVRVVESDLLSPAVLTLLRGPIRARPGGPRDGMSTESRHHTCS